MSSCWVKAAASSSRAADAATLTDYKADLDKLTTYIPSWVTFAVAIALGQGTMIG